MGVKIDKAILTKVIHHFIEFLTYCILFNFKFTVPNLGRFFTKWRNPKRSNEDTIDVKGYYIPKIIFAKKFKESVKTGECYFTFPSILQDVLPSSSGGR